MTRDLTKPPSPAMPSDPAMPPGLPDLRLRIARTGLALLVERLVPAAMPALALLALFLIVAWAGLFPLLDPAGRMLVSGGFLIAVLAALLPLLRLRLPRRDEITRRLDASRPDLHRPLAALSDSLATAGDSFSAALWTIHRTRAAHAAAALAAASADARLRARDRYALRAGLLLALVAAAFVAGDERQTRLAAAFDWSSPRVPPVPPRLDAWIDPPAYTGRPPIFLTSAGAAIDEAIRVPLGSVLTMRLTEPRGAGASASPAMLELSHGVGLHATPPDTATPARTSASAQPGIAIERRVIRADDSVRALRGGRELAAFRFSVIPDRAPAAILREVRAESAAPERQQPGGVRLGFTLEDDYGIAKAELLIERSTRAPAGAGRTLFPPPGANIPLRLGDGEAMIPTEDHPWAGEEVTIRLRVEDDIGQTAESEARTVTLPGRPFSQALARALAEQRRALNFSPDLLAGIRLAFDALLFEPQRFTPKIGEFLALDTIRNGLRTARDDEKLKAISDEIHELALYIENGDMTEAERRLREAEARLRDAMERNASPEEIRRLAEELRRAMDQFLREFAERALRDQDRNAQDQTPASPERMLTQRDLNDMLRRIEELARQGRTEEAQRLLNELRQMLENLRTARRQDVDPRMRELGRQIEELDRLQREQRDLRDRTFREGQQRGRQNQQGQGGGLDEQQQALRERLRQLRERLRQRGMQEGEGFGEADQGMEDAEGQLGQGNPGGATEGQQRALDGLGRAAEGMAQELQRQLGQGGDPGEGTDGPGPGQPGPGTRGRADSRYDPLGRPQNNNRRDFEDSSRLNDETMRGTVEGSISERAERVLRELRRRLGEFERPREELDYLERLLRQR
ncbi:TIGR02302 family protein [Rhabdaerophilum calidifontis]|uniref:TIGR02302 family protein n=1 Tax=Rhabdaerophilum calidifontis TaxID=2604328 RepID=UPI00140D3FFD|nr:TIGR02302 family protein [Rhabdaerophilum calidifontis]